MAVKLSSAQRSMIAEKLMEWGNLVFTGLVIGQFVPGTASVRWWLFLVGVIGIGIGYLTGIILMKAKGGD